MSRRNVSGTTIVGLFVLALILTVATSVLTGLALIVCLNSEFLGAGSLVSLPDLSLAQAIGVALAARLLIDGITVNASAA